MAWKWEFKFQYYLPTRSIRKRGNGLKAPVFSFLMALYSDPGLGGWCKIYYMLGFLCENLIKDTLGDPEKGLSLAGASADSWDRRKEYRPSQNCLFLPQSHSPLFLHPHPSLSTGVSVSTPLLLPWLQQYVPPRKVTAAGGGTIKGHGPFSVTDLAWYKSLNSNSSLRTLRNL